MELKTRIRKQYDFASDRWLNTKDKRRANEIITEPAIEQPASRSLIKNISTKIKNVVISVLLMLDIARRYTIAGLYLTVAIPSITIMHVGEKFMLGAKTTFKLIGNLFKNLFSKFMKSTTDSTTTTETRVVVYGSNLLSFSNNHTIQRPINHKKLRDMVESLNDMLVNDPEALNKPDLLVQLKKEYALINNTNIYTIADTSFETGNRVEDFITYNKHTLITTGLRLLEDEKLLNEDSYKGLFNRINLNEFITSDNDLTDSQTQKRLDYLAAVICVAWALSELNKRRGYDVKRGSYTITDNDTVYKFFLKYVKLTTNSEDPGYFINYSSFAYGRNPNYKLSSHYKNDPNQYGIDMRFEPNAESFGLLPHGHKHILFGLIRSNESSTSTFFKFEEHGMGTIVDLLNHGIDFANSSKVYGVTYREKDIPTEFKEAYSEFCRLTGEPENAKLIKDMWQHINQYTQSILKNILPESSNEESTIPDWDLIKNNEIMAPGLKAQEQFKSITYKYKMQIAHLPYRCGSEVVMHFPDLHVIDEAEKDYGHPRFSRLSNN